MKAHLLEETIKAAAAILAGVLGSLFGNPPDPDILESAEKAMMVLDEMHQTGLPVNVITQSTVIKAFSKAAQLEKAFAPIEDHQRWNLLSNVVTYSVALSTCSKVSKHNETGHSLWK